MESTMTREAGLEEELAIVREGGLTDETFAALLDEYDFADVQRGDLLTGTIMQVASDNLILDIGVKRDAFVPRQDLERLPDSVVEELTEGKEVRVVVIRPRNREGQLIVSVNKALQMKDWDQMIEWMESEEIIERPVIGQNSGGVLVEVASLRGFVPDSHLVSIPRSGDRDTRIEKKKELIGNPLRLKVIDVDPKRNRLVLSERLAAQELNREKLEELEVGTELKGRVVGLKKFGAFVDIGGINGLVHISELDWQYISHPAEVVSVGDEIDVKVIDIEVERGRVALSRKAVVADPWPTLSAQYQAGDVVVSKVASTTEYGIFAELPSGLVGLVHLSEMSTFGTVDPEALVRPGELMLVRVNEVDVERQRIELSIDKVPENYNLSWMQIQDGETFDPEIELAELTTMLRESVAGEE